jgi:hypothetical protein
VQLVFHLQAALTAFLQEPAAALGFHEPGYFTGEDMSGQRGQARLLRPDRPVQRPQILDDQNHSTGLKKGLGARGRAGGEGGLILCGSPGGKDSCGQSLEAPAAAQVDFH